MTANRFVRILAIAVFAVLAGLIFSPRPASAIATGAKGWCTSVGAGNEACVDSPLAACALQWSYYASSTQFGGYMNTFRWDVKDCRWSRKFGVTLPADVTFECQPGYAKIVGGVCVATAENVQSRAKPTQSQQLSCGSNVTPQNNGGGLAPATTRPIDISTGSKLFVALDFETADHSLKLERRYNSQGYMTASLGVSEPYGLAKNWRLSFQHELHIYWNFQYIPSVELLTADGGSYDFSRNGSGNMVASQPDFSTKQTDYTVEFVGTWPSNLGDVLTTTTQWRVHDPDDTIWLFQSYLDPDTGNYGVAHPIQVTFRGGLQWNFTYGAYNELSSITDSYGKSISFTWILQDPSVAGVTGNIHPLAVSSATLPDSTTMNYIYEALDSSLTTMNQADRLIRVEHRDASSTVLDATTYLYENSNLPYHVTGVEDVNLTRRWTVEYDVYGRATASKGPSDVDKSSVSYGSISSGSRAITVTNSLGKNTVYNFSWDYGSVYLRNIAGSASTNCPASTRTFSYSSQFITSVTDEESRVTQYTRESRGLPTQIIDGYGTPSARTTNVTWHSTLRVPTEIAIPGRLTTDFTWNSSGQLTQVTQTDTTSQSVPYSTNGQTRTWAYTYDSYGHLLTIDGPLSGTGDTVTYTYNTSGYLASITDEVGHVLTVSAVNGRGQPTTLTDPNSVTINLTYDSEGRVKTIAVDPSGANAITSVDYDAVGDVAKITRPNGAYLQYTWDDGRRLTKVQDNTGAYAEFDRDTLGNATGLRIKSSSGTTTLLSQTATYDELGRLLTAVGASSQTWTNAYDKTDNKVSVTDPRSNTYSWAFDSLRRLISETNEESAHVTLSRDASDNISSYQDPRSLSTSYVRNGFGEVIQSSSPDTGTTVYYYTAQGKVSQTTDARSVVTNLTYDNAGRLLTKQYPASTGENITYTWDSTSGGNNGVGRMTKVQDASGSVEFTYNTLGQVTQEKKTTASIMYTIGYTYDLDGNVTEIVYPSGRVVDISRDSTGRVSGVTTKVSSGGSTVTLASSVAFLPYGPLQSLTYGNGLTLTRSFDQDYRIGELAVADGMTVLIDRGFSYADAINLTGFTDAAITGRDESYSYSATNRLNSGAGPWGSLAYTYDGVGNRSSEALTSGSTTTWTYAYPTGSNKLSTVTQGSNVRTVTHDAAGNVTADNRVGTIYNYAYNNRGRLSELTIGSTVTADYTYDGLERLAIRTTQNMTPAGTTHYVYDLAGHLIAESDNTGQALREYIWLDDIPLAVVADIPTSPNLYFVHADHLDRPFKMTDGSKSVVWDAIYRPFGAVELITGSATNNLRFPGQYFLLEDGLHYNWYRHYDPTLGRFLQADPLRFVNGPSVYEYAQSDPMQLVDPSGLAVGDWWDLWSNFMRAHAIGLEELRNHRGHNNADDAMRHAEWMRRTRQETNRCTAWIAGVGHELTDLWNGEPWDELMMDLHNNAVGRDAGANYTPVDPNRLRISPAGASRINPYGIR